jgi:hypothetical protein
MTTTSVLLTDIVEPKVYFSYDTVDDTEKTAFVDSGIAVTNPALTAKANSGGKTVDMPFWNDLDPSIEPNYSSDDPDTLADPNKVDAAETIARVSYLNQGYAAADLVGEIAGSDPLQRIRSRFSVYWQRQFQRRILAIAMGLAANNIANDDSDMMEDISIADGANATADNVWSRSAFIDAAFSLGDMFQSISAIGVHSLVYKRMLDNNDIDTILDSDGSTQIPTVLGRRVIYDDSMPVVAGGTSGFVYTSVLFGASAIGYGVGTPKNPVETQRSALAGNGGGLEFIVERKTWLVHPLGHKFNSTTVSAGSPTLANLALATNWTRQVPRKNVPIAFLRTNG